MPPAWLYVKLCFAICYTSSLGKKSGHLLVPCVSGESPEPAAGLGTAEARVAGGPYVVARHGWNHHFAVHSSAQGPPRGLCVAIRREIHRVVQLPILQATQPMKQRWVRLLKRLLKRRATRRGMRLAIQVTTQVAIHAPTRVPTQVATQSSIRSNEHRAVLRETQGTFRRAFR